MTKTLIVVYKDEMLMNQLKKMVETNDDIDGNHIVGTTDGSINIVSWSEKVWLGNKKAGNIKDKVLFLGDIKGTDKLIPVVDVVFDEYGVKFGWAGNQAILFTDLKPVNKTEDYRLFIDKLSTLPIPEIIKKPQNLKVEEEKNGEAEPKCSSETVETEVVENDIKDHKKAPEFLKNAKKLISNGADFAGKAGNIVADKAEDLLRNKDAVKRQQLFYGLVNLYNNGLEQFMNM